jgi:hypothetical protein
MNALLLTLALLCQTGHTYIPGLDPQPGTHWAAGFAPTVAARIRLYDTQMTDRYAASIGWPHRLNGLVYDDLDRTGRRELMSQQLAWMKEWGNPPLPGQIHHRPDQVPAYVRSHPQMLHGGRPIPNLSSEERRGFGGRMTVMEAIRNVKRLRAARERAATEAERSNPMR